MALPAGSPSPAGLEWGRVIGLPVAAGTMASVCQEIARMARRGEGGHVCVANVHMLVEARRDGGLRAALERAALVVSDGRPLVWQLRRHGFPQAQQVRGPDLLTKLCETAAAERLPVYFYGGDQELMNEFRPALLRRVPGLAIAGAEAPPILPRQPAVDAATVERIRRSGARLVFVGLGCPKQEFWMHAYRPHLDAVLIGVGQAFSIATGRLPEAPGWMRRAGLEWLFRVLSEPRRLWRRYLVTNTLFGWFLLREFCAGMMRANGAARSASDGGQNSSAGRSDQQEQAAHH
jgi:N-acetylglucosaminyldiphosphoundecaprenol N-acetyl-beta-D-mannosaminyltransferase